MNSFQLVVNNLKKALYKPSDNELALKSEIDELKQQVSILNSRCDFLCQKIADYQMSLYVYHSMIRQHEREMNNETQSKKRDRRS